MHSNQHVEGSGSRIVASSHFLTAGTMGGNHAGCGLASSSTPSCAALQCSSGSFLERPKDGRGTAVPLQPTVAAPVGFADAARESSIWETIRIKIPASRARILTRSPVSNRAVVSGPASSSRIPARSQANSQGSRGKKVAVRMAKNCSGSEKIPPRGGIFPAITYPLSTVIHRTPRCINVKEGFKLSLVVAGS
ncbi:hypothetical protein V1291_001206 [Nitrobacteraceae bacterium AZCC 1564]